MKYNIPTLPLPYDLETKAVLKQVNRATRKLAELKGVALTIPNENILISTLTLQEAKDSSEVENIVTTQDDLYKEDVNISDIISNAAAKEVLNNLFRHPYTKIEFVEKDMIVTRKTASKYLEVIVEDGLLSKMKIGKDNYYINDSLVNLFLNYGHG